MPGLLTHSPADVLRRLLIDLGYGSEPATEFENLPWPIYVGSEPPTPDNCITLYDTGGTGYGFHMIDGERQEKHGIQVRIRAVTYDVGYTKACSLANALDTAIYFEKPRIGSNHYKVPQFARTSDVLSLGQAPGGRQSKMGRGSRRQIFTINGLLSVRAN